MTDFGKDEHAPGRGGERVKAAERAAISTVVADGFVDHWNRTRHRPGDVNHGPQKQRSVGRFHIAIQEMHGTLAGQKKGQTRGDRSLARTAFAAGHCNANHEWDPFPASGMTATIELPP
jgi:hypothetical protein